MLANLEACGVRLTVDGGALVVEAPRGVLTDARRSWLARHRCELLRELLTLEAFEAWEERAAMMAEGCAWDRDRAEREALRALPHEEPRDAGA